jgi:hypothetical protein
MTNSRLPNSFNPYSAAHYWIARYSLPHFALFRSVLLEGKKA